MDNQILAHTKYNCTYHIVFIPKYRRKGDGWLLLYKRLSESRFQWPRTPEDVRELMPQQFRWLMEGLTITPKKSVRPVEPPEYMG